MRKDIFFSYQSESLSVVEEVCHLLEDKYGIGCWYAPRDVKEAHAPEIIAAIKNSKIFMLFEDENVASNPRGDILNEIHMASEMFNRGDIKILRLKLSKSLVTSYDLAYYVGRVQFVDYHSKPKEECIKDLLHRVREYLGEDLAQKQQHSEESVQQERYRNAYFSEDNKEEIRRLEVQQKLLRNFDKDVYDKLLAGKSNMNVLDLGSNDGSMLYDRLGTRDCISKIIATELEPDTVARANRRFEGSNIYFYQMDVEANDFVERIQQIMDEHQIDKFDLVNISMLLLHVENPHLLVWKLRRVMKKGAVLFIRDIDDGFNVAYPDPQGDFRRTISICSRNEDSGFRESGREIFTILQDAKFNNIKLEKLGMSTVGMDLDEREAFFDVYFSFILADTLLMMQRYPENEDYKKDYQWLSSQYDELEEAFYQDNFFFNIGFMIYTAER